jgi:hypothetical protein
MLNDKDIKTIEKKLNNCSDIFFKTQNIGLKELNRGNCQGIAFVLEKLGYSVEWDDGKAVIVYNG